MPSILAGLWLKAKVENSRVHITRYVITLGFRGLLINLSISASCDDWAGHLPEIL